MRDWRLFKYCDCEACKISKVASLVGMEKKSHQDLNSTEDIYSAHSTILIIPETKINIKTKNKSTKRNISFLN